MSFWALLENSSILWGVGWLKMLPPGHLKVVFSMHIRSQWNWVWIQGRKSLKTYTQTERHSACQTTFSHNFLQWNFNCSLIQIKNIILERISRSKMEKKFRKYHFELPNWTRNLNPTWTLLVTKQQPSSLLHCLFKWL